jgi:RNA polymerase sigma factor (sigma-70 family)
MDFSESELVTPDTAESLMIEGFDKKQLLELMATLSVKQKEAIFLRLVKKFSYQEISKSMNLSLSAVKSLINRGKNSLVKLHSEPKAT